MHDFISQLSLLHVSVIFFIHILPGVMHLLNFYFPINHSVGDINYQSLKTVAGTAFKASYFLSPPELNYVIFLIYFLSGIAFSGFSLAFRDTSQNTNFAMFVIIIWNIF